jgi:hypothetical protein
MVNAQNVGQRVSLKYYRVTLEMRNSGATCVTTNLRWMNFNSRFTDINDSSIYCITSK